MEDPAARTIPHPQDGQGHDQRLRIYWGEHWGWKRELGLFLESPRCGGSGG